MLRFLSWVLGLSFFMATVGLSIPRGTWAASTTQQMPVSVIPNDPYWERQWYLRQIRLPEAWAMATATQPVTVAIIDVGIDITHPDLRENIWVNPKEIPADGVDNDANGYIDDVHGWNFVSKSGDVRPMPQRYQEEDAWSHGTFVASIVAAKGNNREGMAGVNWNARIMPLVALDGDGFGQTGLVVQAIRYAVNQGASIINLSLAGFEHDPALEEMIQRANDAGVLVVAATGNTNSSRAGSDTDYRPMYPVCMDGKENLVLGVGGTDTLDQKSPYANYGKRCTDLSAPAQEFFGARPSYPRSASGVVFERLSTTTPNYLDGMTGTSLAAPLVSGVASLLKSVRPELTPAQLKQYLIYHTDRIEETLTEQQRGKMGSGRLNAASALRAAIQAKNETAPIALFAAPTSTVVVNGTHVFTLRSSDQVFTWVVTQTPLFSGWISSSATSSPVAYVILQDAKGYEWKKWDPRSGRIQTRRLAARGKGWKVMRESTHELVPTFRFTLPAQKQGYALNVLTGIEKSIRLP